MSANNNNQQPNGRGISNQSAVKKYSLSQRLQKGVKRLDVFGIPVSLTYKSDPHLKSFIGGLVTLLVRIGVFAFLATQIIDVINRKTNIQSSYYRLDLSSDPRIYNLTEKDFDMAFKLEYIFFEREPDVQANLDQYVDVRINQNYFPWVEVAGRSTQQKIRYRQQLEICKYGRLGLYPDSIDYLNIVKNYYCPKKVNLQLQGSYSAQSIYQIQIQVQYCNQGYLDTMYNKTKQCKSKVEQERVAANLKLYYVIQNSYFDQNDFSEDPIKKFLKPYFITSQFNTSQSYYFLLSKNEATLRDSWLLDDTQQKTYIETRVDYMNNQVLSAVGQNNSFISLTIQMDDTVKTVSRTTMTFMDALKNTGGFMSVLFVIALNLIQYLQKTIYFTSLVKSLFKYQTATKDEINTKGTSITNKRRSGGLESKVSSARLNLDSQNRGISKRKTDQPKSELDSSKHINEHTHFGQELHEAYFESQDKQGRNISKRDQAGQDIFVGEFGINEREAKEAEYQIEVQIENNSYDITQSRIQRIFTQFKKRVKLDYTLTDVFKSFLRKIGCFKQLSIDEKFKDKLFANGKAKINKELDIRYIAKELRNLRFISSVLLTKYQRHMIPFFKGNLLNEAIKDKQKPNVDQMRIYLQQALNKKNQTNFDKRLIKQIELQREEDIQFEEILNYHKLYPAKLQKGKKMYKIRPNKNKKITLMDSNDGDYNQQQIRMFTEMKDRISPTHHHGGGKYGSANGDSKRKCSNTLDNSSFIQQVLDNEDLNISRIMDDLNLNEDNHRTKGKLTPTQKVDYLDEYKISSQDSFSANIQESSSKEILTPQYQIPSESTQTIFNNKKGKSNHDLVVKAQLSSKQNFQGKYAKNLSVKNSLAVNTDAGSRVSSSNQTALVDDQFFPTNDNNMIDKMNKQNQNELKSQNLLVPTTRYSSKTNVQSQPNFQKDNKISQFSGKQLSSNQLQSLASNDIDFGKNEQQSHLQAPNIRLSINNQATTLQYMSPQFQNQNYQNQFKINSLKSNSNFSNNLEILHDPSQQQNSQSDLQEQSANQSQNHKKNQSAQIQGKYEFNKRKE
eukprot:403345754